MRQENGLPTEVVYDMPQSEMQDESSVQDVTPDVIVLPDTKKENK